jgi:hypothetical protein
MRTDRSQAVEEEAAVNQDGNSPNSYVRAAEQKAPLSAHAQIDEQGGHGGRMRRLPEATRFPAIDSHATEALDKAA